MNTQQEWIKQKRLRHKITQGLTCRKIQPTNLIIICLHTVIWFQVFLSNTNNFQTKSIWPIYGILTGTITMCESGLGSNGNEGITPHSPELQNWSLTTKFNLVSHSGHSFLGWISSFCKGCSRNILSPKEKKFRPAVHVMGTWDVQSVPPPFESN